VSAAHGNITTKSLERRTRAVGFLTEFSQLMQDELERDTNMGRSHKDSESWKVYIKESVKFLMSSNKLFELSDKPRYHDGFKNLNLDEFYCPDMAKYKAIITTILEKMDHLSEVESVKNN